MIIRINKSVKICGLLPLPLRVVEWGFDDGRVDFFAAVFHRDFHLHLRTDDGVRCLYRADGDVLFDDGGKRLAGGLTDLTAVFVEGNGRSQCPPCHLRW